MSNQVNLSDALQNSCMIVTVNTSALGLTRLDKRASAESDDAHNAVRGAARVIVSRLPGVETDHRDLIAVQNDTRAFTYGCTAPWGVKTSDGRRIMANKMFETWIAGFAARHEIFMRKRDVMLAKAPDMIAEAERIGASLTCVPRRWTNCATRTTCRTRWSRSPTRRTLARWASRSTCS